ncbi:hypothetical protein ACQ4PT_049457 [Festuca glaucescens]
MDATIGDPTVASSVERVFESQLLPGTWGQVTFRSMAISVVLGTVFGFVGLRIMMKAGIIQALNLPINVLSFFFLKWFINLLRTCGFSTLPFSRQENVLILTTVTTCLNVAICGGFANYVVGMTSVVAKSLGVENPNPRDVVDNMPTGRWMLFLFVISMVGIMTSVPLNKPELAARVLNPLSPCLSPLVSCRIPPAAAPCEPDEEEQLWYEATAALDCERLGHVVAAILGLSPGAAGSGELSSFPEGPPPLRLRRQRARDTSAWGAGDLLEARRHGTPEPVAGEATASSSEPATTTAR